MSWSKRLVNMILSAWIVVFTYVKCLVVIFIVGNVISFAFWVVPGFSLFQFLEKHQNITLATALLLPAIFTFLSFKKRRAIAKQFG